MEEEGKSCAAKTLLATGGNCGVNMFVSLLLHLWTVGDVPTANVSAPYMPAQQERSTAVN